MTLDVDPLFSYRSDELSCALGYFARRQSSGSRLLEIGAGTGHQAIQLVKNGFQVTAIDLDGSPYRDARVFPVKIFDGCHLPFETNTFDVVFSSNVMEHVDALQMLLSEATRVLKPGGVAVHIMPTPAWRFWTLLTHFPWVLKRTIVLALGFQGPVVAELGRPKARAGLAVTLATVIPRRHGEHGTLMGELWSYRRVRWMAELERSGLQPVGDSPAGIFYTGAQLLGTRLELGWRRKLARFLGSAVHVYCFRKALEGTEL